MSACGSPQHRPPTAQPRTPLEATAEEFGRPLHLRSLREGKRVLDVNAEVADSAFDLRMTIQYLHRTQVARLLVDNRGFGSAG
jgi:hypothetical protein